MSNWFFEETGPRWFNIAADRPFLDDLAAGLLDLTRNSGPEALADAVVLTPNRRAARLLTEAFLRAAGEAPWRASRSPAYLASHHPVLHRSTHSNAS